MKKAPQLILSVFAVIGLVAIIWTIANLGREEAKAGEPSSLPTPKAENLAGSRLPQKVIPSSQCETVAWRQWVGDATTGTKFEITKLGVDGGVYLVFTSEHGVFVVKQER